MLGGSDTRDLGSAILLAVTEELGVETNRVSETGETERQVDTNEETNADPGAQDTTCMYSTEHDVAYMVHKLADFASVEILYLLLVVCIVARVALRTTHLGRYTAHQLLVAYSVACVALETTCTHSA